MVALLERVLGILAQVVGLLLGLQGLVSRTAIEHQPYAIETITANGTTTVTNPTFGNSALHTQLTTIAASHTLADILAAIAAITPTPPAPPPSAGDISDAVWLRTDPNSVPSRVYGDEIWEGYLASKVNNVFGLTRYHLAASFAYNINDQPSGLPDLSFFPQPDWTDIRPEDTRLTWLQRTDLGGLTWEDDGTGNPHGFRNVAPFPKPDWYMLLSEADFNGLKATAANSLPPIWPGLANVVLGTPVALATDLTITTPMHGVVIEITGVASKYNSFKFSYDGLTSYRKLGALTFLTDRGDAEMFQMLSFELAVYCPNTMAEAASIKLECATGTTGTITPWLRKQP